MSQKHAIFTASDANCVDFLIHHWLKSLRDNVDLYSIDVIVLDYGFSERQRSEIESAAAVCRQCQKGGLVNNIRFRDMAAVLRDGDYDQAVMIDAGDVIFQADISQLFEQHKDRFRATCTEVDASIHRRFAQRGDFHPDQWSTMLKSITGKPMVDASNIFAPSQKLIDLWNAYERTARGFDCFGSEQLFLNWYLHQCGFIRLPAKYHFSFTMAKERFSIRDGVFYDAKGEVILVAHNSGRSDESRLIAEFGYGPNRNTRIKHVRLLTQRWFRVMVNLRCSVARKLGR